MERKKQPKDPDLDYVPVNQLLGNLASFGPLHPDLIVPLFYCVALGFVFTLNQPFHFSVIASAWLFIAWWLVAGRRSYQFTDRLFPLPGKDWIDANTIFIPATDPGTFQRKQTKNLVPIQIKTPSGKTENFVPFQKESNLHAIMEIYIDGYQFAVLLMYDEKNQWTATIPWNIEGLHTELYREEVIEYSEAIDEMCKYIPYGEHLTFLLGCKSDYSDRQTQLETLAKTSPLNTIGLCLQSEKLRGKQLTTAGKRQEWYHYAFCSWTRSLGSLGKSDWLGRLIGNLENLWKHSLRILTGTQKTYWEDIYAKLAKEIFDDGFLQWQMLLATKGKLKINPLSAEEIFHWLWYRFNEKSPPNAIPQVIKVRQTSSKKLIVDIEQNDSKELISVLIQGEKGKSKCPSVQGRDTVWVNDRFVAAMAMENRPQGWKSTREQLKCLWEGLSKSEIRDTEVWVQISPANTALVKDNLIRLVKQNTHANNYAFKDGSLMDVNASMDQQEALEAQRLLCEEKRPLYTAPTFLIYRQSQTELNKACAFLAHSFRTANLVRENRIAWKLWTETFPFNNQKQLTSTSMFSERRSHFDSSTVAGMLPLTKPKPIDKEGVEFIYHQGGFPLHIDLFTENLCALITAKRGGGKSVVSFALIRNALARGIPIVGMDMSLAGDSTFKLITQLLGEHGAYVELTRSRFNLMQPPDLRSFYDNPEDLTLRRNIWLDRLKQTLVTIAMGKIYNPELRERVEVLTLKLLEVFFDDPIIVARYNEAMDSGWRSSSWQNMPTLHDLLPFCSREKLGLQNFEEIDRRAINQLVQQIGAKLRDPNIGDAIGSPSNISPSPLMQIFAFSGLTNENNSLVMSLVAQMACQNIALAHSKSCFLMDECSVLLDKPGFAEAVGENFATGRKHGQSAILIGQDLESIKNSPAASKILGNLDISFTGHITSDSIAAYAEILQIPRAIISKNSTDVYASNPEELASRWLIKKDQRFWDCWYYAPPIELAALANNDIEREARARFLKRHPNTNKGRIQALVEFTPHYIRALKGGTSLTKLG